MSRILILLLGAIFLFSAVAEDITLSDVLYPQTKIEVSAYAKRLTEYSDKIIAEKKLSGVAKDRVLQAKEFAFKKVIFEMNSYKEKRKAYLQAIATSGLLSANTSYKTVVDENTKLTSDFLLLSEGTTLVAINPTPIPTATATPAPADLVVTLPPQLEEGVPPSLFATATPTLIASGTAAQSAIITWSSTNSTSCSSLPSGITGISGSFTTPPLSATTTYTITCIGPAGQKSKRVTIARVPSTIFNSIGAQQASCSAEAVVGTPYYYCDCKKGAAGNCVAGDDANLGTDPAAPRKSIADAIKRLSTLKGSNTLRFCKGGAFDAEGSLNMPTTSCAPGSTCTDFREYDSPSFASTAKPIFNSAPGGIALINVMGNKGGIRFLNLKLRGNGIFGNVGLFLYSGVHDIMACNLDIDGFRLGVQQVPGNSTIPAVSNITLTGNNFTNNVAAAYLGSGTTTVISKNAFLNNGSGNMFDHSIYVSAANLVTPDLRVSENYIFGQIGDKCTGTYLGCMVNCLG